jgi:hypothetical protein
MLEAGERDGRQQHERHAACAGLEKGEDGEFGDVELEVAH